jgi:hypothetical protein
MGGLKWCPLTGTIRQQAGSYKYTPPALWASGLVGLSACGLVGDKPASFGWFEVMPFDWHHSPAGWLLQMHTVCLVGLRVTSQPANGGVKPTV